jgi:hypothetical protein
LARLSTLEIEGETQFVWCLKLNHLGNAKNYDYEIGRFLASEGSGISFMIVLLLGATM